MVESKPGTASGKQGRSPSPSKPGTASSELRTSPRTRTPRTPRSVAIPPNLMTPEADGTGGSSGTRGATPQANPTPRVQGAATQKVEKKKLSARRASLIPGELHLPKGGKALEEKLKSGSVTRLNLEKDEPDEMREEMQAEAQLFTARRGHRRSIMAGADLLRRNNDDDNERYIAKNASFHINTLIDLKKAFDQADEDGSGALDEEEFVNAFRNVKGIKGYKTEEQLCHLFMKIDANSDGTVDWDEFTNHILLEQSRYMANEDEELAQALYVISTLTTHAR